MSNDDIVTRPEQKIDFVEYLRLWASPDGNDQAVRDLHKAADEIERLRQIIKDISATVIDEGINPAHHQKIMTTVKTQWPDFWERIEVAVKEAKYKGF